jgi:hexokinase
MAVNLESGNFDPGDVLAECDAALEASLPDEERARQRMERAVSGAYLPRLLWHAAGPERCRKAGFDPQTDNAGRVDALRNDADIGPLAAGLIHRSADLVAAGLAGLIAAYRPDAEGKKNVGILAEGSMFWKPRGYCERVMATLARLLRPGEQAKIISIPTDASGARVLGPNWIGAACAALSP